MIVAKVKLVAVQNGSHFYCHALRESSYGHGESLFPKVHHYQRVQRSAAKYLILSNQLRQCPANLRSRESHSPGFWARRSMFFESILLGLWQSTRPRWYRKQNRLVPFNCPGFIIPQYVLSRYSDPPKVTIALYAEDIARDRMSIAHRVSEKFCQCSSSGMTAGESGDYVL